MAKSRQLEKQIPNFYTGAKEDTKPRNVTLCIGNQLTIGKIGLLKRV